MDLVTDAQVAIALTVPVPRERMWDLVTAVDRVGEWSPEAFGGTWADGAHGPRPGARFVVRAASREPRRFITRSRTVPGSPAPESEQRRIRRNSTAVSSHCAEI